VTVNRRLATRHEVAIAVIVRAVGEPPAPELESMIEDLSVSGAFVALGRRLSIGTRVALRFDLPTHDRPIETEAVVRWSSDEGIGVQFDGLRAGQVWSVGRFLEQL
jgi:hypothetical protein